MSDELKQCPFCKNVFSELTDSSVPSINSGGMKKAVFCGACFAEGPPATDDAKAIAAWNHRADEPALQQQGEAVAVGYVAAYVVPTVEQGSSVCTTITPHQAMQNDVAIFTHPPKPVVDAAPRTNLYLDLDGVMADFDGAFPTVFGLDHRDMADDEMWLHINAHATFFRDLPLMPGALDFFRSIEHLNPIILTACPKSNYPHVAAQKRAWVREHLSDHVQVLPVLGGRHKPLFMHAAGDVLIDDFRKNTEAWSAAGGIAILHRNFNDTRTALEAALGVKS